MKTDQPSTSKQYARVARIFPKSLLTATNARIKVLETVKQD